MVDPTRAATNQPPPLVGHDVVATDPALVASVRRWGDASVLDSLKELGQFAGTADVKQRDPETKTIIIDAAGADAKGQGQAALGLSVRLVPTAGGTRLEVEQDIQLSGAAAQYGRGMISDVSQVMMRDFAVNMQARLDAFARGVSPAQVQTAQSASGLTIGLRAAWMALKRVARRFFLPYQPTGN